MTKRMSNPYIKPHGEASDGDANVEQITTTDIDQPITPKNYEEMVPTEKRASGEYEPMCEELGDSQTK